jgi:hypothetical protein
MATNQGSQKPKFQGGAGQPDAPAPTQEMAVRQRHFDLRIPSVFSAPKRPHTGTRWCITYLPVLLLAISLAAPLVRAQGDASISGFVADATGSAIPRTTIRITSAENGSVRTIFTDDAGRFDAALLAVGRYEVSAEKTGASAPILI